MAAMAQVLLSESAFHVQKDSQDLAATLLHVMPLKKEHGDP